MGSRPAAAGRKLLGLLMSLGLLAGLMGVSPHSLVKAHAASVYFGGYGASDYASYGPNQTVTISGDLYGGCIDMFGQFTANVYVVPHGSVSPDTGATMPSSPDAVITSDFTGGLYDSEVIGFTAPSGKLGNGAYDIVLDLCADGKYDPGADYIAGAGSPQGAFSVSIPVDIPILPDPAIQAMKTSAQTSADYWNKQALVTGWTWKVLSWLKDKAPTDIVDKGYDLFLQYECMAMFPTQWKLDRKAEWGINCPAADPGTYFDALGAEEKAYANHYQAIHDDPADPQSSVLVTLGPVGSFHSRGEDPSEPAFDAVGNQVASSSAALDALRHTIEKYQGAQAAGNGRDALLQAQAMRQYAALAIQSLQSTDAALSGLDSSLTGSGADFAAASTTWTGYQSDWRASGLPAALYTKLLGAGFDSTQIGQMLTIATETAGSDPTANTSIDAYQAYGSLTSIDAAIRSNDASMVSALQQLESADDAIVSTLVSELNSGAPIGASAGGPYSGSTGSVLSFSAAGSSLPAGAGPFSYAWDLTGSGSFGDATGVSPSHTYSSAWSGLVGVRITDAAGDAAVAYAPITVTASNQPPVVTGLTPSGGTTTVAIGSAATWSATATDAEGDVISYTWKLDGVQAGTGPSFSHVFGIADAGVHTLVLEAGDVGGAAIAEQLVDVPAPVALNVSPGSAMLQIGGDQQLAVTGTYADGSTQGLGALASWSSGSPAAVTVSTGGLATAVGAGSALVTATVGQLSASANLTVSPPATVTALTLTPPTGALLVGATLPFQLKATLSDGTTGDYTSAASWTASPSGIVTIDSNGVATGTGPGQATVTAALGGLQATAVVDVTVPVVLQSISVTPAGPNLVAGHSLQMHANGTYSDGTSADLTTRVTWGTTSAIATVSSSGLLTAGSSAGSTSVTATLGTVSGSTTVTVTVVPVLVTISVAASAQILLPGSSVQFTAAGHYSDGSAASITSSVSWSSSDTAVATISAGGLATAMADGSTTITASLSGVQGSATLGVYTPVAPGPGSISGTTFYSRAPAGLGQEGTLWMAGGDGSGDTQIGYGEQPRLSPDGRYLAYHSDGGATTGRDAAHQNLWVRDLQTGTSKQVFSNNDWVVSYGWGPDDTLYYDYYCWIYAMNADGTANRQISNANCYDDAPAPSPDGSTIAFHDNSYGIGLMSPDGSGRTFVPNTTSLDHWPSWSPDGQWISFIREGRNPANLYKIHPDGSGLTQLTGLTVFGDGVHPLGAWSADGRSIVVPITIGGKPYLAAVSSTGDAAIGALGISAGQPADFSGSVRLVTVTPMFAKLTLGSSQTYTVSVEGQPGIPVQLTFAGANPQTLSGVTGADGTVSFSHMMVKAGVDTVVAAATLPAGQFPSITGRAVSVASIDGTDLYFTRFAGEPRVEKVLVNYDASGVHLGGKQSVANLPSADGLGFAPDGHIIVGGQGSSVYRVDPANGSYQTANGASSSFHISIDPAGHSAWSGWYGSYLNEIPINPWTGQVILHRVTGDENSVLSLAWLPDGTVYYTAGGSGGGGSFGILDMTTFTAHRLINSLPADHGMTYDAYSGDIMVFGDQHVTQIDVSDHTHPRIISDLNPSGFTSGFDQGTADGKGHLLVANNDGHMLFVDFSATRLIGSVYNTATVSYLDSSLDDVAPIFGAGAPPPPPPALAATSLAYSGDIKGDFNDPATLAATLTETASGKPVAGAGIAFTVGAQTCTGVSDSTGRAACALTLAGPVGSATVTAAFAGTSVDRPSSTSAAFQTGQEEDSVVYTGDSALRNGSPATLSATLTEDGTLPLSGRTLALRIGSGASAQSCTGVTDVAGSASCTIAAVNQPLGAGTAIAGFAGEADYPSASASAPITIHARTALRYTGDHGADFADRTTLSGVLSDLSTGAAEPIAGVTLQFKLGSQTCSATTDASGRAACSLDLSQPAADLPVSVSYAGDANRDAASASEVFNLGREEATLDYTGVTAARDGSPVTLVAVLLADGDRTRPVGGRAVRLTVGSQSCSGTTAADGKVSCELTLAQPHTDKTSVTASFAGDSGMAGGDLYLPASTSTPFLVQHQYPTTLTWVGDTTGDYDDSVSLAARLLNSGDPTKPVAGRSVSLKLGDLGCTATTDSSGVARCAVVTDHAAGSAAASASFAGDWLYLPSNTSTSVSIALEETSLTYTGGTVLGNGVPATLSAILKEDGTTPIAGRNVLFTVGSGAAAQTCTGATDSGGAATCTLTISQALGPQPISAAFAADGYYRPASDSAQGLVYAFLSSGSFVIGDGNAATGTQVAFWDSQWAKDNSVSGGAPSSFKGYAAGTTPGPNSCGGTWSTEPGDSSKPPASLPAYMGVIVTSRTTQDGSAIDGSTTHLVVVKTDPGYLPDPGHRGTGTVVATIC